jgi:lipoprotein-releasing system permease protein
VRLPLELEIALRYLRRRQGSGFLTVIASTSILGVAVGVVALFIALALMTGLQEEIRERILGATAHLSVFRSGGLEFEDPLGVAAQVARLPGVEGAASSLYGMALVSSPASQAVATIKGISSGEGTITRLPEQIVDGSLNGILRPATLARDHSDGPPPDSTAAGGPPGILLGRELATTLAVGRGDVVTLTIPRGRLTPFGVLPHLAKFRVEGIVRTGLFQFDSSWGWISLLDAERLLAPSGSGNVLVEARLTDMFDVTAAAERVSETLGRDYVVSDWIETNRSLFEALKLEKLAIGLTIGLIVMVAALNIVATLVLMVTEKRRSVAVLLSMGAGPGTIRRIFVWLGLILGVTGTAVGAACGIAACWALDHYRVVRIPADVYQIAYLPFTLKPLDGAAVTLGAVLVALIATLYPANRAAHLSPIDGLRSE